MMDRNRRNLLIGGSFFGALTLAGILPATCAMQQIKRKSAMTESSPPKRPRGEAKPLLEEDIAAVLARLDTWYATHLPPDRYRLNPPATETEIEAFERLIGFELPRSYHQLYRWHDGETDDRWGHVYGLPLIPLEWVVREWKAWNQVLDDFKANRYEIRGAAWPDGAVDPAYINPRRIPLTIDGSGNSIGLDFDPWPLGRVGQVIIYGRDEDVKVVLAESLGKFLEWIAGLLESGNFKLDADGKERLRLFRLKTPSAEHFHEGARTLLGAPGPFL